VTVAGSAGEAHVPVRLDPAAGPLVPAATLVAALAGTLAIDNGWAVVTVSQQPFRFLIGAPLYVFSSRLLPLAGPSALVSDTLFLPFQFVAVILP
jgi:hypothetical protein